MEYATVKNLLADLSLNLDIETIERVHSLLEHDVGLLGDCHNQRLLVYAAAAVVAENELVPTLDRHLSQCGITLEHIVNHLEPIQVDSFLSLLEKIIEKCRSSNANLSWKVDRLRISYRIFSKFEEIVKTVALQFHLEGEFQEDVRRLVWVLFCSCKFSNAGELPINEEVMLLQHCLLFIVAQLERVLALPMQEYLHERMRTSFPEGVHNQHEPPALM
jgi:hypothetical protein